MSINNGIDKLWDMYPVKLSAVIRMNKLQLYTAVWVKLTNIMLSERYQTLHNL